MPSLLSPSLLTPDPLPPSRKRVNNLNSGKQAEYSASACSLVDDAWLLASTASSEARKDAPTKESKAAFAHAMCEASAYMWSLAAGYEMSEEVDAGWLSKYLVYQIGVKYVAFEPRDLLFAIKDLFGLPPVASYDEAPACWTRLSTLAGIEHGTPFGWFRNLSRPGPNLSLVACHATYVRTQGEDAPLAFHGCSARQFGVYGLDETDKLSFGDGGSGGSGGGDDGSRGGGGGKGFVDALALEGCTGGGWLMEDDPKLASFFLGVRLKNATLKKLGDGSLRLSSVDLLDADDKLSLRGQMALREVENRIHDYYLLTYYLLLTTYYLLLTTYHLLLTTYHLRWRTAFTMPSERWRAKSMAAPWQVETRLSSWSLGTIPYIATCVCSFSAVPRRASLGGRPLRSRAWVVRHRRVAHGE